MAKGKSQGKAPGGKPAAADDSLDFTASEPGKSSAAASRRKKPAARVEPVRAERSRSLTVPVLIVGAIVIGTIFFMADRSSKEVVTTKPGKPVAPGQKAAPARQPPPTTAAPALRSPAPPAPQVNAPPSPPSSSAGGHRRAIPAEFRTALLEYASKSGGKAIALALDADGRWAYGSVSGFASHEEAIKEVLADCARYKATAGIQENCKLYAIGDKIVWQ